VDKSYALQKINEQYQQTVQSGKQQLRVIIGGSHGVPSNLSVLPDILQRSESTIYIPAHTVLILQQERPALHT
jgi:23S rRNA pseudoU1915 N3-methylase RlmH